MKREDNQQLIKIAKLCLIVAGYWKMPITNNPLYMKLYSLYCIFMQGTFLFLWALLVTELLRLIIMSYEGIVIILSLSIVVNATKIVIKIIIFKKNNILDFYQDAITNEEEVWRSEDDNIIKTYMKYVLICRRFMLVQFVSSFFAVLTFAIMGVIGDHTLIKYNEANNASLESHFWYQFYFPGNKLNHLVPVYILNLIFSYNGLLYNSITHMVVVTLFVFAASQLHVLRIRISKYEQGRDMNNEQKKVVLKQLIAKHLYLIGFIKNLNDRTKYILLMEFLLSSVDISSVAVNLAKETTLQTIWHFIYFFLLFSQIMIMAWTTNEVKLQSVSIADGLYNTNWYTLNKENAQLIHIMILRSQIPLVLTIGPFGPMTTETGLRILKVAYSYVSIMKP